MLSDKRLLPLFGDLLGFGKLKPFDCVGTFEETQAALFLARKKFKHDYVIQKLVKKIRQPQALIASVMP